jgi:hypothetical protein
MRGKYVRSIFSTAQPGTTAAAAVAEARRKEGKEVEEKDVLQRVCVAKTS